jgi:hypothetical protein
MGQWRVAAWMTRFWRIGGKCFKMGNGFRGQSLGFASCAINAPLAPQGWAADIGGILNGRGGIGLQGGRRGPFGAASLLLVK